MKYALGNMLNGAGGLNPDGLSLDLQFAADKTLTARKGPTPVFTRASTATFVGSNGLIQSAAINAPRFDHDPLTLACKGLLIEESRTNLVNYSEDFPNLYWNSFATASAAQISQTNPSGGSTSSRFTAIAGTASTRQRVIVQTLSSGSTITTYSCFIKAGTSNFGYVSLTFNKSGVGGVRNCDAHIVFSTGVITKTGVSNADFTVSSTPYPNGWYRISVSATSNASTAIEDQVVGSQGISFDGVGGNGSFAGTETIFAWGAQREAGSFPTSYIPTTTASLARSADFCSITGGDFTALYNAPEGTLLVNAEEFRRGTSYTPIFRVANSANLVNNRYQIGTNGNKTSAVSPIEFITIADGSLAYGATLNSATSNFKAALAYSVDNMRGSLNGTLATADTAPSALIIGANTFTINSVGGYISAIRYYKKRLPNAKLVTLTA